MTKRAGSRILIIVAFVVAFELRLGNSQTFVPIPIQTFGKPALVETGQEVQPDHQGFLVCMTAALQPQFRHGSTVQLVGNLILASASGTDAVIVGHGSPAMLCTGNGDSCSGNDSEMVASWNEVAWQSQFQSLKGRYKSITLFACDTGQNPALLTEIAQITGSTVRAPNSIVNCDSSGISFSGGGAWVVSGQPLPPEPTARHFKVGPAHAYRFMLGPSLTSVSPNAVKVIDFQHRGYREREFTNLRFNPHTLLTLIDFEHPFQTKARPGAVVTGKLRIRFQSNGQSVVRDLVLFNDELIEDLNNLDVFYNADSALAESMSALSK